MPLTLAELTAALAAVGGFEPHPLIAVAVSGGPDSMALAILVDRWARQVGGVAWGLTVDHRLRPESAAEARLVGDWLGARGIPHAILVWDGDKPGTGVQAAAREARYRLLAGWCRDHACLHLLTAHQREDQAETCLIRRRAGSGADGLAGMPVVRELSGCRLVRPLLSVARARLAAILVKEGQQFLSDPSNRDPAFERARLRLGGDLDDPGSLADLLAEAGRQGRDRILRERALDALIARAVAVHPAGLAAIDPEIIADAPADLVERLLGRVAATFGDGAPYPPRRARIVRLREGLAAAPPRARTLGGCRFVPWRGRLLVFRELARAAAPARVDPGANLTWDRRFAVSSPRASGGSLMLGYLGAAASPAFNPGDSPSARSEMPPLAYPSLPAFWDADGIAGIPALGYRRTRAEQLPELVFRPVAPLTRAGFTVV